MRYLCKRSITISSVLLEVRASVGMFTKNWVKGVACQKSGDINNAKEKSRYYQRAIEHFTNAIQLMPELRAEAYAEIDLGLAYFSKGELDIAMAITMIKRFNWIRSLLVLITIV